MTPDSLRMAIASNPQSAETRAYLINQAVENDMADEIPDDWTVELHDPNTEYDDSLDLIADSYEFPASVRRIGEQWDSVGFNKGGTVNYSSTVVVNAHESGSVSITVRPKQRNPIVKFGLESADRLIQMLTQVRNQRFVYHDMEAVEQIEPMSGIVVKPVHYEVNYGYIDDVMELPDEPLPLEIALGENTLEHMMTGLTAMTNSAETYGVQEVPQ